MEIQLESRLLEDRIMNALVARELAEPKRNIVYYDSEEIGGLVSSTYQKCRTWVMENAVKRAADNMVALSVGGLAIAGGILYFFPETQKNMDRAKIIGEISLIALGAKSFLPLDRWLCQNPSDVAKTIFRNSVRPWLDVYNGLKIRNKKDLNRYIDMVKSPNAIFSEFPDESHQKALGVSFSIFIHLRK